jgi:hypothetical protein
MQTGCPYELEIVTVGLGSKADENRLHRFLTHAGRRHQGEWFVWCLEVQEVIAWLNDRAFKLPPIPRKLEVGKGRLGAVRSYEREICTAMSVKSDVDPIMPTPPAKHSGEDDVVNHAAKALSSYLRSLH